MRGLLGLGGLKPELKRALYMATVRAYMLYPCVPWEALSSTHQAEFQVVQNQALNFIGNYNWQQMKTSRQKSEEQRLRPINAVLKDHSQRVWDKLLEQESDLFHDLASRSTRLRPRFKTQWPSSLQSIGTNRPEFYTRQEARNQRREELNY